MSSTSEASPIRILMLEDSALDAELIGAQLKRAHLPFTSERVWTREAFLAELASNTHDIILADHVLPGFDGDTALTLASELAPEIPFIFVSGTLTEELAVQALTRGARDYVVKQRLQRLPDAVVRALKERDDRRLRQHAERELHTSRERLQLITDALPALIAHLDIEHRYRFANNTYRDWHGLSPEQLVGKHISEVLSAPVLAEVLPHLQRILAGERTRFETELPVADGSSRHLLVDGVPERAADGSVTGYYTLARDISDLKRAEQSLRQINDSLERKVFERTRELRESQGRLQAVFQSSFQLQALLDPQGHVLDANVAALSAILAEPSDVAGKLFWRCPWFARSEAAGAIVNSAVQAATEGKENRHELELDLVTGHRSFEFSFRPLRAADGSTAAIVAEAVETTERRLAEEALRQTQKIEAVGQLTGGIAHDFNNILTVIAGNVEHAKLLSERGGGQNAPASRALDNALKGVMRAASLTQRLLAFARRQPLRNQLVDLNQRVGGMEDMLQRALGEMIQLDIRLSPQVWCVELDPAQLEASLLNLVVNARDAMPDGGRLSVETSNGHLDENDALVAPDLPPGRYAMLRVRDRGHGMDAETIARVFEPFFTTKEVGRGTGLGLSMVYGFAKQSGGHVLIDSQPGQGTVVTLLFPASSQPMPEPRPAEPDALSEYEHSDETVLVAEDNDDVRAHTVETLRQFGYRVLEAHDGASAVRLLQRRDAEVDLLFSDIVMPGMTGWELARQARAIKPGLKILFTSGYPRDIGTRSPDDRQVQLLPKPFTRADLATAVRSTLDDAQPPGS